MRQGCGVDPAEVADEGGYGVEHGWEANSQLPTPNARIQFIIHHSSTSNGGGGAVICGEGFIQRSNLYTPPSAIITPTLPDVNALLGD